MMTGVEGNGPKRFSVRRKLAVVARLLRGEPLELVARETNVSVAKLTERRDRALSGAATALKERERDDRDDEIAQLKSKGGEITIDNELLSAKIAAMEGKRPLATGGRGDEPDALACPLLWFGARCACVEGRARRRLSLSQTEHDLPSHIVSELRATEFSFRYAEGSAIPAPCLQRPFLVSRLSDADIREQARRCAATLDHRACSDEDTPCKWRPGGGWDGLPNLTRC